MSNVACFCDNVCTHPIHQLRRFVLVELRCVVGLQLQTASVHSRLSNLGHNYRTLTRTEGRIEYAGAGESELLPDTISLQPKQTSIRLAVFAQLAP